MTTLAGLITQRREALGIATKQELADTLGVTGSFISQLEAGTRIPRKHDFITRLADALDVDPDDLYHLIGRVPEDMAHWITADRQHLTAVRHLMQKE
jgi:transcriptional regulator with XRE-family HTH domain